MACICERVWWKWFANFLHVIKSCSWRNMTLWLPTCKYNHHKCECLFTSRLFILFKILAFPLCYSTPPVKPWRGVMGGVTHLNRHSQNKSRLAAQLSSQCVQSCVFCTDKTSENIFPVSVKSWLGETKGESVCTSPHLKWISSTNTSSSTAVPKIPQSTFLPRLE